jgi:hypothetical protein
MQGNEQRTRRVGVDATAAVQVAAAELLPPVGATVARNFLDLLRTVRGPARLDRIDRRHPFLTTPALEVRITEVLDAVCTQDPEINRACLEKIIREDPYQYSKWPRSGRRSNPDTDWRLILDFPQLAAHWENPVYNRERAIAQTDYGVDTHELHFLRAVYEQLSLTQTHLVSGWDPDACLREKGMRRYTTDDLESPAAQGGQAPTFEMPPTNPKLREIFLGRADSSL